MLSNSLKKFLSNNYGLIIFATLGIMSIPLMLYVFNSNEFADDPFLLLIPSLLTVIFLVFGLLVNIIGSRLFNGFNKFNLLFQSFLSSLGLVILFNDIFVPTQATALNGELNLIPEPVLLSIIEFLIGLLIYTFIMVNFKNSKVKKILSSIAAYSISMVLILGFIVLYYAISSIKPSKSIDTKTVNQNKTSPNIYFLWFDGMQSDYFIKAINEDNQIKDFNNFTLYKNNISNYLYTLQSYQSFMSGTIFDGDGTNKWNLDDRLRSKLKSNNYHLSSYGMPQYVSELDDYQMRIEEAVNENLVLKHPYFSDFISLSLVKMTPNFLANESLLIGQILSDKITTFMYPRIKEEINSIDKGMYPNSAPMTYKHLLVDEENRKTYGEFILAQIILPHPPFVLDENCDYRKPVISLKSKIESEKYYLQVRCATKLLTKFIKKLKKLDRYDKSIIVVMSDHGAGWTNLMQNEKLGKLEKINARYNGWNEPQLIKRASSLLMIKPALNGNNEELKFSLTETQLIDIVPTLFDLLNWETEYKFDGRSTFSSENKARNSILTYYKPTTNPDFDDTGIYHINYDVKKGRTKLSFINTFNEYFNRENKKSDKQTNRMENKQIDEIKKLTFDE